MSIGSTLAQAREAAGRSVEDVARATRIRRTLVVGIENDDFAPCGGDFYARGHIRAIASSLGVDPAPLLQEFDAGRGHPAPRATEVFESEWAARPERRGPNWSAAMAAALVLVLAFGVVRAVGWGADRPAGRAGSRTTTSTPAASTPAASTPAASTPAAGSGAPTPTGGAGPAPATGRKVTGRMVTVAMAAVERSWVQVSTRDGAQLFAGLLEPGTSRTFTGRHELRLVLGNAGGVELTVNGRAIGAPGRRGQVARLQFTPAAPAGG